MARRRLTLKRIDPWSVLKFGFVANLALLAIWLLGAGIVWFFVRRLELIEKVCEIAGDVAFVECGINGGNLFRALLLLGLLGTVIQTGLLVFLAFLHNLIADLVGGIGFTFTEEGGAALPPAARTSAAATRPAPTAPAPTRPGPGAPAPTGREQPVGSAVSAGWTAPGAPAGSSVGSGAPGGVMPPPAGSSSGGGSGSPAGSSSGGGSGSPAGGSSGGGSGSPAGSSPPDRSAQGPVSPSRPPDAPRPDAHRESASSDRPGPSPGQPPDPSPARPPGSPSGSPPPSPPPPSEPDDSEESPTRSGSPSPSSPSRDDWDLFGPRRGSGGSDA